MNVLLCTPTSVSIELCNGDAHCTEPFEVYLDGEFLREEEKNVFSVYGLVPGQTYELRVRGRALEETVSFQTKALRERVFWTDLSGGEINETKALQQAIDNLQPDEFLTISGIYKITSLFLKDNLYIYLPKESRLIGETRREEFPVLQAEEELNGVVLGTWEGEADDSFAGFITGLGVKNVCIYGEGTLDCNAQNSDWWVNHRVKRIARRPKGIFIHTCENISLEGITVCNTPSWNQHPFHSKGLRYINMHLENPADSPTTDGIDPESCEDVLIVGTRISVGDDCIAIKSGKLDFARKYRRPSKNIVIRNCRMEFGHAGVTIGSENSGGVRDVQVTNCVFHSTDRGLRIKSQRGRGNLAVIENITFRNIRMEGVKAPFVINAFYKAGTDAVDWRFAREECPVTELTPKFREFMFEDIRCENVSYGVGFFLGLPESMLKKVTLRNICISYQKEAKAGEMAMTVWKEEFRHAGFVCENLEELVLENVVFEEEPEQKFLLRNVKRVVDGMPDKGITGKQCRE